MKIAIAWALVILVITIAILPHSFVNAKSSEEKAIGSALKKVGYKNVCKLGVTTKTNNQTNILYTNTKCTEMSPPTPQPQPTPTPEPTGPTTKVCLIGDLKGSTVPNKMKDCNLKIGLGDLGYASDLSYFKGLKFDKCVIGNHDSPEDGSSSIYKEALSYCGDHWSLKIGTSAVMVGLNTNGDPTEQITTTKSIISQNPQAKTIIIVSHKGGHVPPNSHHPAEAKTLYAELEKLVPNLYEISGHNHNEASAANGHWFISGAGGKSHYACGTSAEWNFCDNSHDGYLQLTIDNQNGNIAAKFVN